MNYYLSIIPYFGAVKAGLAPPVAIKYNPEPSNFCSEMNACPDDVEPWAMFFSLVASTSETCTTNSVYKNKSYIVMGTPIADTLDFNLTSSKEQLLDSLWAAHLHSIDAALPKFTDKLGLMSQAEAEFSESWATLVDFIASAFFLCDLKTTDVLQSLLPERVLVEGDQAPKIKDLSRLQNRAIFFINALNSFNIATEGKFLTFWYLFLFLIH
jgi:hypothetical protein